METVKVYMVRKPSDFEEVKTLCKKYTHEAEEVLIEGTVNLPPTWYEALCQRPLDNYIFLLSIIARTNATEIMLLKRHIHSSQHLTRT